jgi:hypothetical protein
MVGDAKAIAGYIHAGRWRNALERLDEFLGDWDDRRAEITDTKTMDMYAAIEIIDPAVRENAPAFEAAPSEDARYANDDEKYRKAVEYIINVRGLISRGFRVGGRRRSKRGKSAKRRRHRTSLTRRRRRFF